MALATVLTVDMKQERLNIGLHHGHKFCYLN